MRKLWNIWQESAKAAAPYHGRLVAHYLLVIFSPVLVFFWVGLLIPIAVLIDTLIQLEKINRNQRQASVFGRCSCHATPAAV